MAVTAPPETAATSRASAAPESFVPRARLLVGDLFAVNRGLYWADLIASAGVGWAAFVAAHALGPTSAAGLAALVVAVFGLYRTLVFIHEIAHRPEASFGSFVTAWNLLCGIPLLTPSFLYETHADHHTRQRYGTAHDGEYVPWARLPARRIVWFLAGSVMVPLLTLVRFLVLAPSSWLSEPLRAWVLRRASALVMNAGYLREPLPAEALGRCRRQEAACLAWGAGWAGLIAVGVAPLSVAVQAYAVVAAIVLLNSVRVLCAHRYLHAGEPATADEQVLDSITHDRRPALTALWAPVGLRFHAVHHLFPAMPYHALGQAHRRLLAALPAESPYRATVSPGLATSLTQLWRAARAAGRAEAAKRGRRLAS